MRGFAGHHHSEETKKLLSEKLKGHAGNSGSFKKGFVPWNKGKKMSEETKAKLRPTLFQKGNKTWNHKPLFSERKTKDGYTMIKIAEPSTWKLKHLWIYEQHYNVKVDVKKECVIFLDGDRNNFDIDNLMLITRALNRVITSHPEYKVVKGNAELSKINIARAKVRVAQLDLGEKLGLVVSSCGYRYFTGERTELARKYREEKKKKQNEIQNI